MLADMAICLRHGAEPAPSPVPSVYWKPRWSIAAVPFGDTLEMNKVSTLVVALLCGAAGGAHADDPDKDFREASERYWEHQRELEKADMEAYKEHEKFHEEMEREERKHFEEMEREDAKRSAEFYREREKAYRE